MRKRIVLVADLRKRGEITFSVIEDHWAKKYYIAGEDDPVNTDPPIPHRAEPRKKFKARVDDVTGTPDD